MCLKPDGTAAFSGKFVQQGGLNFASVSSRSSLDAGTYSLRIVSAGATDCNTSLNGLGDIGGVAVDGGSAVTVGLVGLLSGTGSGSVAERTFVDDTAAPASPGVKLRFLHVSPELGQVDVGRALRQHLHSAEPGGQPRLPGRLAVRRLPANALTDTLALVDTGTANLRLSGGSAWAAER